MNICSKKISILLQSLCDDLVNYRNHRKRLYERFQKIQTIWSMLNKVGQPVWKRSVTGINPEQAWLNVRRGNKDALSKLFCHYYQYLFNYGYKLVAREDLVKDSIQELFMTIWNQRDRVGHAFSVKSYLLISLRRLVFKNLQKQKNQYQRNHIYIEEFSEDTLNIEEYFVRFETEREYKKRLTEAVKSLSKRQKEAISLKFYDGLSTNEIACVMEINRQSVYNHVSEGIRQLQGMVNQNSVA